MKEASYLSASEEKSGEELDLDSYGQNDMTGKVLSINLKLR